MPKLYSELASWYPLLSSPADYAEEAEFARKTLVESSATPLRTILELGAGVGNNASHLKASLTMTLTDLSASMLDQSRRLNPECEHLVGDMRTLRLGRLFDAVFVHDALTHLTTREDIHQCLETAQIHCRPQGAALFMPDVVRERFVSGAHHGGYDADGRGLRYVEWTFDPDPADHTYTVDYALLLREGSAPVRVEHDHHVNGLFARAEWLQALKDAGFHATRMIEDSYGREVFVAVKE